MDAVLLARGKKYFERVVTRNASGVDVAFRTQTVELPAAFCARQTELPNQEPLFAAFVLAFARLQAARTERVRAGRRYPTDAELDTFFSGFRSHDTAINLLSEAFTSVVQCSLFVEDLRGFFRVERALTECVVTSVGQSGHAWTVIKIGSDGLVLRDHTTEPVPPDFAAEVIPTANPWEFLVPWNEVRDLSHVYFQRG
jgi:hypothetical protein